ncbi:SAC3 domain-containing protein 1-like isoform X2 [Lytechinus variegatus]|uniref:SAC3 domain-containing protein 1-like isoform X2 n=1 Tax=Lytechinus variegatus TaxID=7654 RepID=UPI001BB153F8|nr:SAC3 domain-containing protein 1-like isoform X2 [Lytechinus variegatus]
MSERTCCVVHVYRRRSEMPSSKTSYALSSLAYIMSYHPKSLFQRLRESLERNRLQNPYGEAEHAIAGECQEMCPKREQKERENQRRLHTLEMVEGTERERRPKVDCSLAIKEYSRPAAGKEQANPCDLRPPEVLMKVVNHIVQNILTRTDLPWFKIYNFAFDRLRAVRQDLVIQRASGSECVMILEQCARFHIYSAYRLCSAPLSEFDPKINSDHTSECLKRLLFIYQLQRQDENIEQDKTKQDAQIQMESCHVLFNLGSFDTLFHILSLPKEIRLSPRLVNAVALAKAFLEGNYIRVKKLAVRLSAIELCCLHTHLQQMRSQALTTMNAAFSSRNLLFPMQVLTNWLMFDEVEEAQDFCHHYGLTLKDGKVVFSKSCSLQDYKLPPKRSWCTYIDCQLEVLTIPDIIQGAVR